jgi:hypothetical protein
MADERMKDTFRGGVVSFIILSLSYSPLAAAFHSEFSYLSFLVMMRYGCGPGTAGVASAKKPCIIS